MKHSAIPPANLERLHHSRSHTATPPRPSANTHYANLVFAQVRPFRPLHNVAFSSVRGFGFGPPAPSHGLPGSGTSRRNTVRPASDPAALTGFCCVRPLDVHLFFRALRAANYPDQINKISKE